MFINPSKVERITSKFRTKERPNHHGVDFAQAGTHEIVAVADGVVTRSYVSPSYGEVVFIAHNINGQKWESVYAHLRQGSRRVRVEAKVKQGQVIGIMGNTGDSSGQHLHFELHKVSWNINKTNAVDPLKYLGKGVPVNSIPPKNAQSKSNIGKTLYLDKSNDTWAIYDLKVQPIKKNANKIPLRPKKFGGLSYKILAEPYPHVYTIQTFDFGKMNIVVKPEYTGFKIK